MFDLPSFMNPSGVNSRTLSFEPFPVFSASQICGPEGVTFTLEWTNRVNNTASAYPENAVVVFLLHEADSGDSSDVYFPAVLFEEFFLGGIQVNCKFSHILPRQENISRFKPATGGTAFTGEPESGLIKRLISIQKSLGREGFEPSKAEPTDLQSAPFDRSGISPYHTPSQPSVGFEPTTPRLQVTCSGQLS